MHAILAKAFVDKLLNPLRLFYFPCAHSLKRSWYASAVKLFFALVNRARCHTDFIDAWHRSVAQHVNVAYTHKFIPEDVFAGPTR